MIILLILNQILAAFGAGKLKASVKGGSAFGGKSTN